MLFGVLKTITCCIHLFKSEGKSGLHWTTVTRSPSSDFRSNNWKCISQYFMVLLTFAFLESLAFLTWLNPYWRLVVSACLLNSARCQPPTCPFDLLPKNSIVPPLAQKIKWLTSLFSGPPTLMFFLQSHLYCSISYLWFLLFQFLCLLCKFIQMIHI